MQNRYVGDVGDYAKYALLRRLAGIDTELKVRLGVVWCLYPDENHNNDGRHTSYLRRSEFAKLDAELISTLRQIVESGNRSISAVIAGNLLPSRTIFCNELSCLSKGLRSTTNDRLVYRNRWLATCLGLTKNSELVFFDPDNGIEVASIPKHHPNAGKYIYWDELVQFWRRGQALLIYHHLNRTKSVADQITQLTSRFRSEFVDALVTPLVFRRGSCRAFWLICPRTSLGREVAHRATAFVRGDWAAHFDSSIRSADPNDGRIRLYDQRS